MLTAQSISEQLMYSTVRLSIGDSTATGFFYELNTTKKTVIVVSNRHFAEQVDSITKLDFGKDSINQKTSFSIHLNNGGNCNFNENITWILHPTKDLAFFDLTSILSNHKLSINQEYSYIPISETIIPTQKELDDLFAIEEVVMVGYPNGLYDSVNNYPIFRTGKTASHPAVNYSGKEEALIDVSCVPGSSGSPVFILNEGWIRYKNGGLAQGNRIIFLGIENSMPTRFSKSLYKKQRLPNGQIEYVQDDEYLVKDDMKLGYYIKSSELAGFGPQIMALGL